jgi:hypothetical protein
MAAEENKYKKGASGPPKISKENKVIEEFKEISEGNAICRLHLMLPKSSSSGYTADDVSPFFKGSLHIL